MNAARPSRVARRELDDWIRRTIKDDPIQQLIRDQQEIDTLRAEILRDHK